MSATNSGLYSLCLVKSWVNMLTVNMIRINNNKCQKRKNHMLMIVCRCRPISFIHVAILISTLTPCWTIYKFLTFILSFILMAHPWRGFGDFLIFQFYISCLSLISSFLFLLNSFFEVLSFLVSLLIASVYLFTLFFLLFLFISYPFHLSLFLSIKLFHFFLSYLSVNFILHCPLAFFLSPYLFIFFLSVCFFIPLFFFMCLLLFYLLFFLSSFVFTIPLYFSSSSFIHL